MPAGTPELPITARPASLKMPLPRSLQARNSSRQRPWGIVQIIVQAGQVGRGGKRNDNKKGALAAPCLERIKPVRGDGRDKLAK